MTGKLRCAARIADRVAAWIEKTILLLTFLLLAAVTALQIVSRPLNLQTTWTLELGGYLLVWMIFSGAALGVREWRHVRFDALIQSVPSAARRHLARLAELLVLGFAVFLLWTSVGLVERQLSWGQMTATLPANINIGAMTAIMPVAGAFMIVHLINRFLGGQGDDGKED